MKQMDSDDLTIVFQIFRIIPESLAITIIIFVTKSFSRSLLWWVYTAKSAQISAQTAESEWNISGENVCAAFIGIFGRTDITCTSCCTQNIQKKPVSKYVKYGPNLGDRCKLVVAPTAMVVTYWHVVRFV